MGGDFFNNTMARVVEYVRQSQPFGKLEIIEGTETALFNIVHEDGSRIVGIELEWEDLLLLSEDIERMYDRMSSRR